MKKLILVVCLICTAGIAEASSKRNNHHANNNGLVVQTVISASLGILQIRPTASLINVVVVNTPAPKVHYIQKRPVVAVVQIQNRGVSRKKGRNEHYSRNVKNHRSNVRYSPYYYK